MPNWKIHIAIGNEVNKYLKFKGEDQEKFLFANVLPDINNANLVTDVSMIIPHDITHFKNKKQETYQNFYDKYEEKIKTKDPLYVGYLLHLFTDYYWNSVFYHHVKNTRFKNKLSKELKEIKHHDFRIYNNKYINNILQITDKKVIISELKSLSEVKIKEKDIDLICEFLKNQSLEKGKLIFFKNEELDTLFKESIKEFKKEFIK